MDRSHSLPLAPPLALTALALAVTACGSGKAAKAVQPDAPTAAQAVDGKPACESPKDPDQPLVVDMPPEDRTDLEIAMKSKVAVVSYDCKTLKVLRSCHVDGDYGYFGTTLQEKTVRLTNADEINVNLPLTGVGLVAKLGGSLESGSTLDLAMLMVGARRTTWNRVTTADLKGSCEGATHFVLGAFIGAFAMGQGSSASVATTATIFGAGGDAKSASAKSVDTKAGDPSSCQSADPNAHDPPSKCAVAIRLELLPIGTAPAAEDERPHPAATLDSDVCPSGYVLRESKCTKPDATKAHRCSGKDAIDCAKQCDLGDGTSCELVGDMYRVGEHGVAKDAAKAFAYEKKGCGLKDATACFWQAKGMLDGHGVAKDVDGGVALMKQACTMGSPSACHDAGISFINHQPASWPDAFPWFTRGCDGGDQQSCKNIARCYALGGGACGAVQKDPAKAVFLFKRACNGDVAEACSRLGEYAERGEEMPKSVAEAARLYEKGCEGKHALGCLRLAQLYGKGDASLPADPKKAATWFERGLPDHDVALEYGGDLVDGKGVAKDKTKGVKLLHDACTHEKKYTPKKEPACDALTKMGEKVD